MKGTLKSLQAKCKCIASNVIHVVDFGILTPKFLSTWGLTKFWEVARTYEFGVNIRDLQNLIEKIWKICICHYENITKWLCRNSLHRKFPIEELPKGWVDAFSKCQQKWKICVSHYETSMYSSRMRTICLLTIPHSSIRILVGRGVHASGVSPVRGRDACLEGGLPLGMHPPPSPWTE